MQKLRARLAEHRSVALVAIVVGFSSFVLARGNSEYQSLALSRAYAVPSRAIDSASGQPVDLVVFTDYQCGYCREFEESLARLNPALRARVRVYVRHLPIEAVHPFAVPAALAVECAAQFGRRTETHVWLFANQESIGATPWTDVARAVGIANEDLFNTCITDAHLAARVRADVTIARRLKMRGTPTIIVNGVLVFGVPDDRELGRLIRKALRGVSD